MPRGSEAAARGVFTCSLGSGVYRPHVVISRTFRGLWDKMKISHIFLSSLPFPAPPSFMLSHKTGWEFITPHPPFFFTVLQLLPSHQPQRSAVTDSSLTSMKDRAARWAVVSKQAVLWRPHFFPPQLAFDFNDAPLAVFQDPSQPLFTKLTFKSCGPENKTSHSYYLHGDLRGIKGFSMMKYQLWCHTQPQPVFSGWSHITA